MFFRLTASAFLCAALVACGGGSESSTSTPSPTTTATPKVEIASVGATQTIDQVGSYRLEISGLSNNLTVAADDGITVLSIMGNNNVVVLLDGATVNSIDVTGVGNTISLPANQKPALSVTGVNSKVVNRP